jgi:hypothetical protein
VNEKAISFPENEVSNGEGMHSYFGDLKAQEIARADWFWNREGSQVGLGKRKRMKVDQTVKSAKH